MYSATLGVIEDARGHRRRRRVGAVVLMAICVGVGGGVISERTLNSPARPLGVAAPEHSASAPLLSGAPFMGVACHFARSCDSVGLAVWLRRPAVAVNATIAGHSLKLTATTAYPRPGARATFVGYLRSYRLVTRVPLLVGAGPTTWDTDRGWPSARVQLRIDYGHGRIVLTRLDLPVEPGWG
jgi:hypothetical protein